MKRKKKSGKFKWPKSLLVTATEGVDWSTP